MRGVFDTIAQLSARQHGRISYQQLLAEGVDARRIERWLRDGRLRRAHRGIYAVGHTAPSWHADLMAAVLACGEGARASHHSAGHLAGILKHPPPKHHITVPTTAGRARPGIVIHRVKQLHPLDAETWHGIPATAIPRTLLDLAPHLTEPNLGRACHEAWIRHRDRARPHLIEACIARNPRKPGATKLRRAIGADVTLSILEDGFLALLKRHHLPTPRTNIDHAGDKVDCHWPDHGLTIELLSYTYHATRHAFEQDVARRRRSNHTAYTYGDIFQRGAQTASDVARLLAGGATAP
jgi:Transcriptional regulator, AbiEi antitoxin